MASYGGCTCPQAVLPMVCNSLLTACLPSVVFGPMATNWYRVLQKHVNLSTKTRTIAARVAADQIVFTPVNLTLFLSSMAFFEGWPPRKTTPERSEAQPDASKLEAERGPPAEEATARERVEERIRTAWWTAFSRNLLVWPAVQVVNFSVVPLEHRVLVVNVVALGWNCYLSYLNGKSSGDKGKDE
jgi:protein Mpv17